MKWKIIGPEKLCLQKLQNPEKIWFQNICKKKKRFFGVDDLAKTFFRFLNFSFTAAFFLFFAITTLSALFLAIKSHVNSNYGPFILVTMAWHIMVINMFDIGVCVIPETPTPPQKNTLSHTEKANYTILDSFSQKKIDIF